MDLQKLQMGQITKQKSMLSASPFPPLPKLCQQLKTDVWLHTKEQKKPQHKQTISKTTVNDGRVDREQHPFIRVIWRTV